MRLIGFLALVFFAGIGNPALAAVHALVVGIDDYAHSRALKGAVNDAQDMARVLARLVDGKQRVLINAEATRAAFLEAWSDILAATRQGDVILLHFSGHGLRDTDDNSDEADGYDEFFLFQPFGEDGAAFQEKLRDDELAVLFKQAKAREVTVLFVADTCYSGGLTRAIAAGVEGRGLPFRFTRLFKRPGKRALLPADFVPRPEMPDNVVFLAATHEKRRVQEILIEGKPRGALSYYVARALEGSADKDGDGVLSAGELIDYVSPNVRAISDSRQIPVLEAKNRDRPLIPLKHKKRDKLFPQIQDIKLAIRNAGADRPDISGARIVELEADAEFIWDRAMARVVNPSGDVLASWVEENSLQQAIDAKRVRAALLEVMKRGDYLSVHLNPDDRLHSRGCRINLRVDTFSFAHFTVVVLTGNGTVQFLFPIGNDPVKWEAGIPWRVPVKVSAPFGADFIIFIASEKPLPEMHLRLKQLNGKREPLALYLVLKEMLRDVRFELGVKGIFTARKGEPCGS